MFVNFFQAIPDHYDKAESVEDTFMPNLRKFIQTTRSDAEESLSVQAGENLELQDELFKLAEVLQIAKSNQFQFAGEDLFQIIHFSLFRSPV